MSKWYGKFGYDNEGIVDYIESESREVAQAYVDGINRAIEEIECGGGDNQLESYWTSVDQIEPIDEGEPSSLKGFSKSDGKLAAIRPITIEGKLIAARLPSIVRVMNTINGDVRFQNPDSESPYEPGFWSEWVSLKDIELKYLEAQK